MSPKFIIIAALAVVALARPDQAPAYGYAAPTPAPAPAKYDFNYAVKDEYSGNDFGHQEARDGYDTQGSYYVQLPDGRPAEGHLHCQRRLWLRGRGQLRGRGAVSCRTACLQARPLICLDRKSSSAVIIFIKEILYIVYL
ncbi:cuticle protein-like [Penaeus indicus]|uniref:cuticle protein-like n=1 Tax=Penaeus indicus TaxID=29960 RepID=UPI00300D071B